MSNWHAVTRRRPAAAVAAGTACALAAVFATAGPARSAVTPHPGGRTVVPQGTGPAALAGARVTGDTAKSTREHVSFILKARNLKQLEFDAETGTRHGYLSVSQFANSYGQPSATVTALRGYLAQYKITTSAYADRLDVQATGTAAEFSAALGVVQKDYSVPAVPAADGQRGIPAQHVYAATGPATLPGPIASSVLTILGLSSYSPYTSSLEHAPQLASGMKLAGTVSHSRTPENFAADYGLGPLYKLGYTGAGQTIGIVTLASLAPSTPYYFWRHILHIKVPSGKVSLVNVDGGAGPPSLRAGSDETTLDVEQAGALAPGAHIDLYQAANTDPGFADAFYAAASRNVDESVSTSWGESETFLAAAVHRGRETPAYVAAFDQAFLELDAQGQSSFDAAGDDGAYDADDDIATTNLSVDTPANSPYITAAGGTTLPGTVRVDTASGKPVGEVKIPAQRAWGWDWFWPLWKGFGATSEAAFAKQNVGGGGGGFSTTEATPLYQENVPGTHHFSAVEYLTPSDYKSVGGLTLPVNWKFSASPKVTTGTGTGRAVPDVSADADPLTGYIIYDPQYKGNPIENDWGGTSFVAPQFNGSTAIIDQYIGGRVGFWNPSIYRFAAGLGSPVTPLTAAGRSNDNLYYAGTPGQIYNPASGLGVPDMARLAAAFATQDGRNVPATHR